MVETDTEESVHNYTLYPRGKYYVKASEYHCDSGYLY